MPRFFSALMVLLALTVPLSAKADISEAIFTPQGRATYSPIQEELVEVFVIRPEFKFRVIGVIEARGMAEGNVSLLDQFDVIGSLLGDKPTQPGEKEDIALALQALRKEAAQAGASGVVILKSVQVRVSPNATERRILAAAIRPE